MRFVKSDEAIVFIFSLITGCLYAYYSYSNGLIRVYGDASSHLNIARGVVDSLTPGISQLVGVWLPFVHVSMLPFIWNDFLWQTGLAGTIPSLIYFVITSVFLYKLAFRYFEDKQISYLTVFIFICNPYSLYFATAPMFEMTFMMTLVLSTYYFYKWLETSKLIHLSICSFFIALSTLTWYPGWALPLVFLFLLIMKLKIDRCDLGKAKAYITVYCLGAFFGIGLWLLLNWMIYGNPIDFLINEYSVHYKAKHILVPTKYDLLGSITTAIYAIHYMIGVPLLIFSVIGSFMTLFHRHDMKILSLFALSSPGIFFTVMLFFGHSAVAVPELCDILNYRHIGYPSNVRYYLTVLPFVAIFTASFINEAKRHIEPNKLKVSLMILLIILFPLYNMYLIEETYLNRYKEIKMKQIIDTYSFNFSEEYDYGTIFQQAYGGIIGYFILKLEVEKGVHLSNIIRPGNYPYYDNALREPWNYSKWLFLNKFEKRGDEFSQKWQDSKFLHKLYSTIHEGERIEVLKLNESALPYLNIYQQSGYFEIENVTFHGYSDFTISNFNDFQHSMDITIKCNESKINKTIYYVMPNSDREINIKLPEECYTCENITLIVEGERYMVEKILKNEGVEILNEEM